MTNQSNNDSSVSVDNPKPLTNAFIDINLQKQEVNECKNPANLIR